MDEKPDARALELSIKVEPGELAECPDYIPHKKFHEGASFNTDYKVIERCEWNCPACVWELATKAQLALDRKQGKPPSWEEMPRIPCTVCGTHQCWEGKTGEKQRQADIAYAESVCRKCQRGER